MNEFERTFLMANDQERAMGFHWYLDAHNYLKAMAAKFNKPLSMVCAMVAVTSPLLAWSVNVNLAYNLLKNKGKFVSRGKAPCFRRNLNKAQAIYKTKKVFPSLRGPKVEQFYQNLLEPLSDEAITIDSFMIACWIGNGTKPKDRTIKHYSSENGIEILKNEIRVLAVKYDLLPLQFQAIVWIVFHRLLKSMASYNGQMYLKIF